MEKIKLGSLCIIKNSKTVEYENKKVVIEKGTYVTVCDDDSISKGFVLVEIDGFDTVFGFSIDDLILIHNTL
jgi:hypothetical protein